MNDRDHLPAHHVPGRGYRNPVAGLPPKGLGSILRWRWQALRQGLPKPATHPTPRVTPELEWLHSNAHEPTVTWIGHSSTLVQLAGWNVLMDPVFSERVSPVAWAGPRRHHPPGLALEELPPIHLVLVSHTHYDHLDAPSLKALAHQHPQVHFLVPLGLASWFRRRGLTAVTELDWWECHHLDSLDVVCTPAHHWSGRGIRDRMKTLWGGFALRSGERALVYTGDTGYSDQFQAVGERLGPFDVALIPIGAYAPRWFMAPQHIDPTEAVAIARHLKARQAIGIHWGTFSLSDEALDDPPRELAAVLAQQNLDPAWFRTMALGETLRW